VLTERHDFQPGQSITVAPRQDMLHLFDTQSGMSLRTD